MFMRLTKKKPIFLVYILSFLFSLGWFASTPFFAIYLINIMKASPAYIGFSLSISYIFYMLSSFKTGQWVDRYSPELILKVSCVMLAVVFLWLYIDLNTVSFLIANMLFGILRSAYRSASNVMLTHYAGDNSHKAYNTLYAIFNVGVALATIIGALFAYMHSHFVFLYCVVMFLLMLVVSMPLKGQSKLFVSVESGSFFQLFRVPFMLWLLLSGIIYFSVYSQINTTLPMLLHVSQGSLSFAYAKLLLINAILIVVFQYPIRLINKYTSFAISGFLGCIVTAISLVIIGSTGNIYWLYLAMVFFTFGEALLMPLFNTIIAKKSPKKTRGRYFGFFNLSYLGGFLGPAIGGLFFQIHWFSLFYYLLALLILLSSWCIYLAVKSPR